MTLHITPEMCQATYAMLLTTPPYRDWSLPVPEEVRFKVSTSRRNTAVYQLVNGKHTITVSGRNVGTLQVLTQAMAHEMIHVHEENTKLCRPDVEHSWRFKRWAESVCKWHLFDPKAF